MCEAEQMYIRKMEDADLPEVVRLWQGSFGDEAEYIEFYFREYQKGRTTWLLCKDELRGMVTEMECSLIRQGKAWPIRYQYAGGVFPKFRGQGLFPFLMRARREQAKRNGEAVIFEPGPGLFEYYRKLGYQDVFSIMDYVFPVEPHTAACCGEESSYEIVPCMDPERYRAARDAFFGGDGYVAWNTEHVRYAIEECRLEKGGVFEIRKRRADIPHLVLIGGVNEKVLQVKEAVIPDETLKEELSALAGYLGCRTVTVRLPIWSSLPGKKRAFGVGYGMRLDEMERPYLNLTLD